MYRIFWPMEPSGYPSFPVNRGQGTTQRLRSLTYKLRIAVGVTSAALLLAVAALTVWGGTSPPLWRPEPELEDNLSLSLDRSPFPA
jgi:hypothetical protein